MNRFKSSKLAILSALAAGILVFTGTLGAPTQAAEPEAEPQASSWVLGYDDGTVAASGDIISNVAPTHLEFTGLYSGNVASVICDIDASVVDYTVPTPPDSAPPGGSIAIPVEPPTTIGGAGDVNGRCTESVTGNVVEVTIPAGTVWTLSINVPSATSPSPWTAPLSGSIHVPQNSFTVRSDFLPGLGNVPPCIISGPTDAGGVLVPGTYDPATGTATPSSEPLFHLDNSLCPQVDPEAALQDTTEVTLEGLNGKIPTAIYVP